MSSPSNMKKDDAPLLEPTSNKNNETDPDPYPDPAPKQQNDTSSSRGHSPTGTPDSMLFASNGSTDSMILVGEHMLSSSPPASSLLAVTREGSSGGESNSGGGGPRGSPGAPVAVTGEVLRRVIGDLKELECEASTTSVKEGIADQRRQLTALLRANVQRRWRKVVTGDETKRVRDHIREPPVSRNIDKMAFTFGVLNLTISEFMLVKFPQEFWAWYMAVIPILVFFRIPHYRSLKWEFFLLDFCYYVQVLCILQLYAFPRSCALLKSNFLLANGPLAFAVPVWRNSLVFHDVEKITSLYIHIFPGLLTYALKWYPSTQAAHDHVEECGPISLGDLLTASLVYIAWQVLYYIKIEILDRAKLDADPELQTSLRWLAKDQKNVLHRLVLKLTRACGIVGPEERFDHRTFKTKFLFILTQFVYTMLTCLPAMPAYDYFPVHVAYGLFMFSIAVFNGGSYYIEVHPIRYSTKYPNERPLGLGKWKDKRTSSPRHGHAAHTHTHTQDAIAAATAAAAAVGGGDAAGGGDKKNA